MSALKHLRVKQPKPMNPVEQAKLDMKVYRVKKSYLIMSLNAKHKDLARGFVIKEDFITEEYLKDQYTLQEGLCYYCRVHMDVVKRNSQKGMTAERLNNKVQHTKINTVLSCHSCNMSHKFGIFKYSKSKSS